MYILGYLGMILINCAYLPQLFRTLRQRDVHNFSLWYLLCLHIGFWLYLIYAISIWNWVYIVSNILTLSGNTALLVFYFRYKK